MHVFNAAITGKSLLIVADFVDTPACWGAADMLSDRISPSEPTYAPAGREGGYVIVRTWRSQADSNLSVQFRICIL